MKTKQIALLALACTATLVAAACAPTPAPTQAAASNVGQPVAVVELAPICQTGSACTVPSAEQHEIDCVNKMPYTNVIVEPGTSFEVLDKSGDFTCNDSGIKAGGKTVISCFGKELYRFDLKLTNNACGGGEPATWNRKVPGRIRV